MHTITNRQNEVLEFIHNFVSRNSYPPTIREIADNFKVFSGAVYASMIALRRKGYIDWVDEKPRTIRVLKKGA